MSSSNKSNNAVSAANSSNVGETSKGSNYNQQKAKLLDFVEELIIPRIGEKDAKNYVETQMVNPTKVLLLYNLLAQDKDNGNKILSHSNYLKRKSQWIRNWEHGRRTRLQNIVRKKVVTKGAKKSSIRKNVQQLFRPIIMFDYKADEENQNEQLNRINNMLFEINNSWEIYASLIIKSSSLSPSPISLNSLTTSPEPQKVNQEPSSKAVCAALSKMNFIGCILTVTRCKQRDLKNLTGTVLHESKTHFHLVTTKKWITAKSATEEGSDQSIMEIDGENSKFQRLKKKVWVVPVVKEGTTFTCDIPWPFKSGTNERRMISFWGEHLRGAWTSL